ncbi:MAG: M67 family metallopeptidase [Phaeospirillum sp.]|nr:M67 family metallopeptidase [Phaeospirillum sp.]
MITLTVAQLAMIADAAEAAYPDECCGLLVGHGNRHIHVTRLVPALNLLRGEAHDRFELDPRTRFETERTLRGTTERVVGHWHSHPDGTATPSPTDLKQAWEPELVWLIIGVTANAANTPQALQILAHQLDRERNRSRNITLRLTKNSTCKPQGFPT